MYFGEGTPDCVEEDSESEIDGHAYEELYEPPEPCYWTRKKAQGAGLSYMERDGISSQFVIKIHDWRPTSIL